jgi:hypothetical protein
MLLQLILNKAGMLVGGVMLPDADRVTEEWSGFYIGACWALYGIQL